MGGITGLTTDQCYQYEWPNPNDDLTVFAYALALVTQLPEEKKLLPRSKNEKMVMAIVK